MREEVTTRPKRTRHIRDARGRKVTQLDPVAMYVLHRHDEGIPQEVLRELTLKIGFGKLADTWFGIVVGGIGFMCAVVLLISALMELIDGSILLGAFVRRAIWYQGIWAVPFAFWKAARRSRFSRIRSIMLEHFRCPHCGYDIRGLPTAADDGTTVCPECGCAWRVPEPPPTGQREDGSSHTPTFGPMPGNARQGRG